jgi:protein TonB
VNGAGSSWAAGERLSWAIFIAAAAHGLFILGVGFSGPSQEGPSEVPTLEVTLLEAPSPDELEPHDARYLAQANQEGSGNTAENLRPEFHEQPPAPETAPAAPPPAEHPAETLVSSWRGALAASIAAPQPEPEPQPVQPQPEGGLTRVSDADPREFFVSIDARASIFAEYLAAWKARMERLGTLNFPNVAQAAHERNPVLEVAVSADGTLASVTVTRSSGHGPLDQAAIDLVRLASPFDPFPPEVRAQYDTLRFAYEWRFIDGRAGAGVLRAPER